jgi:serine/threonine-protein kinase HipA
MNEAMTEMTAYIKANKVFATTGHAMMEQWETGIERSLSTR